MSDFFKTLTSMKMMALLVLIFATAVAVATFIENDFGVNSSKSLIYGAKWFEIILLLLTINLFVNIFRFKLYRRDKLPIFIFHLAFVFIFVGAGVTRYFGFEGVLSLREGEVSSTISSRENYFQLKIRDTESNKNYYLEKEVLLSPVGFGDIDEKISIGESKIDVSLQDYIVSPIEKIAVSEDNAGAIASFVVSSQGAPKEIALKQFEVKSVNGENFCFENSACSSHGIEFKLENDKFLMRANDKMDILSMDTKESISIDGDEFIELKSRHLYSNSHAQFVFKKLYPKAKIELVSNGDLKSSFSALKFNIKVDDKSKEVITFANDGSKPTFNEFSIGKFDFSIGYGAKEIKLPFALKLKDFELLRYAGSNSPSSYASYIEVIDNEKSFDYKVYMNNILDYKGYRFYQASYDRDELGTVLSVNSDYLGTFITYLGYWALGLAMLLTLFLRKGRIKVLLEKLRKIESEKLKISSFLAILFLVGQDIRANEATFDLINSFDKEHSEKFSKLLIQSYDGRLKPIDTLSRDILNKIYKGSSFYGLSANQIFLGMSIRPNEWQSIKIIKVGSKEINEALGVPKDDKYLAFADFFGKKGEYKLKYYAEEANRKRPSNRNQFDKDIIKVDERINICYMVYTGSFLRIYPKPNDENNKWFAPIEAMDSFKKEDSLKVKELTLGYFSEIDKALVSKDWLVADKKLEAIINHQKEYGASILLSNNKVKAEMLYNKYNIFKFLISVYGIVGLILLTISFTKLIKPKLSFLDKPIAFLKYILIAGFILHTFALLLRWYISGHAPWSNGFESMIYIAWATILAGSIFIKKSTMTISATAILASLTLFVAHLSWMDPEISNLVPVLKSYWLTIHVSLITASYGFLGLGAVLGFITLILFILRDGKNRNLDLSIKELSYINEISLIIGLVFLTIGNFLGGVWANESWGRYWGWDPKESWTLVTMLIYVFVIHLRFIPKFNSLYIFNLASLLSFSSVIMTYFGVNFYLSGLHSYAKGDPVPVPSFVYYTLITIAFVAILAYKKRDLRS